MIGCEIHKLAEQLWGINRSLTGDGNRETLKILQGHIPGLTLHEIPSGTKVFDWTVPDEWRVKDAYIITPNGEKICNFRNNNLHLLGYSAPVNKKISLAELQQHLYSIPLQPTAIPYVTSYYERRWGFCISQKQRDVLKEGTYEVYIDSEHFAGSLTYGELIIKGESDSEVFLSTYICHPSMANNELSGPTVTTFLAKWLKSRPKNRFSYRIVFIPETIGSIAYLSRNLNHLQKHVIAGFNVTCVGDDRAFSYLPSRKGNTLSDHIARHVLRHTHPDYKAYKWTDRGSDERQYCAPGVDLPVASIMRTKFGAYEEYHTSLDDLVNVVTPQGLEGGYTVLRKALEAIEENYYLKSTILCEPQLGKRGLYPTLSTKSSASEVSLMMDLITWSDGTKSALEIADLCEVPVWELLPLLDKLVRHNLLTLSDTPNLA